MSFLFFSPQKCQKNLIGSTIMNIISGGSYFLQLNDPNGRPSYESNQSWNEISSLLTDTRPLEISINFSVVEARHRLRVHLIINFAYRIVERIGDIRYFLKWRAESNEMKGGPRIVPIDFYVAWPLLQYNDDIYRYKEIAIITIINHNSWTNIEHSLCVMT